MPIVKKQFSLSPEQNEFIDSLIRKKTFKDKSEVVRHGIELLRQKFQEMELEKMAIEYSNDLDFIQAGKKGINLQKL
jgi:Arc/MetJ-type ribon-helix-helix transcriptional regulator